MKITKNCLILFMLLLMTCTPVFAKTLRFAQIADVHFSPQGSTNSNRDLTYSGRNLRFAIQSVNKQDVKFAMFLGDNIDKSNVKNLEAFLEITQRFKVPYYLLIGNHDAYELSGVQKEDYWKIVKRYNKNQKSKEPYYYFYPNRDCVAIVVDGAMPFAPSAHGLYTDEMLKWLDKVLTKNSNKIAIIFQHFPLIPPRENYSHSTLEPDKYFELLSKHKNVLLVSSGHYHSGKTTLDENGIYHVSVPTLLAHPNEYEVVEINYDKKLFRCPSDIKLDMKRIKI